MTDTFLKYLQYEKRYSPRTLVSYRTDLRQFEEYLTKEFDSKPEEANYGMVRGWIVSLSEHDIDSPSINRKIACLRSFFKFLLKREEITKDPMLKVKVLKVKKKLPSFVNEDELIALLDGRVESKSKKAGKEDTRSPHEQKRDQAIIEMFYGTGMRRAELIGLRDGDINFRENTVKVLGKRNKERVIPFSRSLVSILKDYCEVRDREIDKKDENFFLTEKGEKLYPELVYKIIKAALADLNVEKKSPHVMRHSYATHLLNKGAEINAVKDLLGHTSLAATQVYTHNTIEKLKEAYKAHPKSGQ